VLEGSLLAALLVHLLGVVPGTTGGVHHAAQHEAGGDGAQQHTCRVVVCGEM